MSGFTAQQGVAALQKLVREAEANFAQAFIEQTGLLPSEAVMNYGPVQNAHGKTEFRIWFTTKPETEELRMLRAIQDATLKGDVLGALDIARSVSLAFPRDLPITDVTPAAQPV